MKKNKKPIFLLIEGTVFPFDILISVSSCEDLYKYIENNKKYKLTDKEKEELEICGNAKTIRLLGGQVIIRLLERKTKLGIDLCDLAHEIEHAVFFIMEKIGVKHCDESDEVFAYYQAYLMRKTLNYFQNIKGRKK